MKLNDRVIGADIIANNHMVISYSKGNQQLSIINLNNFSCLNLPNEHNISIFKILSNLNGNHFISTCYESTIKYWEVKNIKSKI